MKKFLLHVLIVIVIVFVVDSTIGFILDKKFSLKAFRPAEEAYNNQYELVLLGASEMSNQYVTKMISDGLGVTAYNFGSGGQNIYYQYVILNLMLNHGKCKPKYVVMETQSIDFYDTPKWNTEKLDVFYPMYNFDNVLHTVVDLQGWRTSFMLRTLRCYKHNSRVLHYILNTIRNSKNGELGYIALKSVKFNDTLKTKNDINVNFDEKKIEYLYRFIHLCKDNDIKLVFVNAPYYELHDKIAWLERLKQILNEEDIPFFNYDNDPYFLSHREWYYNKVHFNEFGAIEYTRRIILDLQKIK